MLTFHYAHWSAALDEGLARIRQAGAELLLVSLGVATFEREPISSFKLRSDDYPASTG
ncbi:MAG: hypothetical protein JJU25_07295 [Halomonas sp.]|nr:hypothetical protein [Halomonas sp.]MCC5882424.1 hypothetical protein [Halomonas sp.]